MLDVTRELLREVMKLLRAERACAVPEEFQGFDLLVSGVVGAGVVSQPGRHRSDGCRGRRPTAIPTRSRASRAGPRRPRRSTHQSNTPPADAFSRPGRSDLQLLRSTRCRGERGFALHTGRRRALRRITASPRRIGDYAKAALVLTHIEQLQLRNSCRDHFSGGHRELWSRKKGTTGFNVQVVSLLDGRPVYVSDPQSGNARNTAAFTATPVIQRKAMSSVMPSSQD